MVPRGCLVGVRQHDARGRAHGAADGQLVRSTRSATYQRSVPVGLRLCLRFARSPDGRACGTHVVFTAVGLVTTGTSAVCTAARRQLVRSTARHGAGGGDLERRAGRDSASPGRANVDPSRGLADRLPGSGVTVLAIGVPTVIRFVRERGRTTSRDSHDAPGMPLRDAVRSRIFWALIVVVFGSTLAMNGALVHLSALLTDRGIAAERAAIVLSVRAASLAGRLLTAGLSIASWRLTCRSRCSRLHRRDVPARRRKLVHGGGPGCLLIGFGTGGEFDITPYLLSRYFGLRALSTLYGLNWTAWGVAGAIGLILMARDSTPAGLRLGARHLCDRHLAVGALMLALPTNARRRRLSSSAEAGANRETATEE